MWLMKLFKRKPIVKLVPIEKDAYVEMLEEEILNLKEQLDKKHKSTITVPNGYSIVEYPITSPQVIAQHSQAMQTLMCNRVELDMLYGFTPIRLP